MRLGGSIATIALVLVATVGALLLGKRAAEGPNEQVAPPARGLPATPDYHSLYVDPEDARRLRLGTHVGLYASQDGGVTWKTGPLAGKDAMSIVRAPDGALWAAGHDVLERSYDDGLTWTNVRPQGLPHLDLHGFAIAGDGRLYAAAAGEGLYASNNGGASFAEVSDERGANVYGLSVRGKTILATDTGSGILRSVDAGQTWQVVLPVPVARLAWGPGDVVLATGERMWRSEDGGATWSEGFAPGPTFEPVAWSASEPRIAYTITPQTRTLYRSEDAGNTWEPIE